MLKKKVLVTILVAGLLVFATNAFALSTFTSFVLNPSINPLSPSWDHILSNNDFSPQLSGSEPLIINSGTLSLLLSITPSSFFGAYLYSVSASLDSYYLGTFNYGSQTPGTITAPWSVPITDQLALNAIVDKNAHIKLYPNYGTLNSVAVSNLTGTYSVAPEPISMVLVGVGMAGLPVAKRFRRFIKRNN